MEVIEIDEFQGRMECNARLQTVGAPLFTLNESAVQREEEHVPSYLHSVFFFPSNCLVIFTVVNEKLQKD